MNYWYLALIGTGLIAIVIVLYYKKIPILNEFKPITQNNYEEDDFQRLKKRKLIDFSNSSDSKYRKPIVQKNDFKYKIRMRSPFSKFK